MGTASAAAALATASGDTAALVQAAVLAVRQGASAEALALALGSASGGVVDPALLRRGDASALAAVVDQNVRDSVEVIVRTSSKSLNAASSAVSSALAVAVEDVCRGGNATAAAAAAANATAAATGEVLGGCGGTGHQRCVLPGHRLHWFETVCVKNCFSSAPSVCSRRHR